MNAQATVAVTGASGFLGSNVCRALTDKGSEVIGIVRAGSPRRLSADLVPLVEEREGDLTEPASLAEALQGADLVVHCAARVSIDNADGAEVRAANADGTANLLDACEKLGIDRLVHVSSVHAFTGMRDKPLNEHCELALGSPLAYPRSKAAAHQTVLHAFAEGRFGGCIVCPGGILGPGDNRPTPTGAMLRGMAQGKFPAVVAGGFWWCDARDVAEAVAAAVSAGEDGAVYFTPGLFASVGHLTRLCSDALGHSVNRMSVPYWLALAGLPAVTAWAALRREPMIYSRASISLLRDCPTSVDDQSARTDLGYSSRPLADTINDSLSWLRTEGLIPQG